MSPYAYTWNDPVNYTDPSGIPHHFAGFGYVS
ncbi:RHS repeat-associated core domain-containing protein [Chryseobacterium taeanense]|nr:hypothetical protein [Chryseobacterium taeanense]